MKTNTAYRARVLAKPTWSVDDGRDGDDFMKLLVEEEVLNRSVDFSFKYNYAGSGDWGDHNAYAVPVPAVTNVVIPEKPADTVAISLSSITRRPRESSSPV